MCIISKNIKSLLCVISLLIVPVNNILAMEMECVGKLFKKETNNIEDVEFTAKFVTDLGSHADGKLISVNLPVDEGEDSIKFAQDIAWNYTTFPEKILFGYISKEKINHYSLTLDYVNGTFAYEEYNKNFGFLMYATAEGNCTKISDR